MCAEEFATFLDNTRKAPLEEKLSAFGDIIEKIMSIVLRIPDLVDQSLGVINEKVSNLQNQVNSLNSQISSRSGAAPAAAALGPSAPAAARAPGSPPPPPPGGPPGGPRGPGPTPGPSRPASPVSLRGAIMGELKSLFAKRKNQSG
ncbi:MAG: hypothetical protein KAW03_01050 [Candidatus Lokiarchaeota archaeon]|nr:hypothetical protein [Candidatus Lokiarchaeota archaeon]